MPTVSVIMGIYNTKCREYLERSINSILNQTYSDFEFIICDDGSANDCLKWAKEICGKDSRVVFLKNDSNKGLAFTLNKCLAASKGKYIARMDDDDFSYSDRFKKEIAFLEKNNEYDLIACNANLINNGKKYNETKFPEIIEKEDFLYNSPIVHPTIIAKKKSIVAVGGYSEEDKANRLEDYDLFMRMRANGSRMATIQEVLFDYSYDINAQKKRRNIRYRINEFKIRFINFRRLGLYPKAIPFTIKPLIALLLPSNFIFRGRIK